MIETHRNKIQELRQKLKNTLFLSKENNLPNKPEQIEKNKHLAKKDSEHLGRRSCEVSQIKDSFNEHYTLSSIIGQGAHGIVKVCYKKSTQFMPSNFGLIPTKYAVKLIMSAGDPELANTIIQTFNINRSLNHISSIIKAIDLFIDENQETAFWVMEYFEFNSLLYEMKRRHFFLEQTKTIIRQLALALSAIHKAGVCHRDIKPDNILIKIQGKLQIKLIDFGVSKHFFIKHRNGKQIHEMWTRTGSVLYQAPEIFIGGGYDEKIDIWATGIILYQLLCNKFPFHGNTSLDTIELITDQNIQLDNNKEFNHLDSMEQDILKRMLQKDPEKRLSADELLLHPWLSQQSSPQQAKDDLLILEIKNEEFKLASSYQLQEMNPFSNTSPLYSNKLESEQRDMKKIHFIHRDEVRDFDFHEFLQKDTCNSFELQDDNQSLQMSP